MGTKTILISEDLYKNLKSMKREDESFGDVVERLIPKKKGSELSGFFRCFEG
jgi:predicted CopG family antitoxin